MYVLLATVYSPAQRLVPSRCSKQRLNQHGPPPTCKPLPSSGPLQNWAPLVAIYWNSRGSSCLPCAKNTILSSTARSYHPSGVHTRRAVLGAIRRVFLPPLETSGRKAGWQPSFHGKKLQLLSLLCSLFTLAGENLEPLVSGASYECCHRTNFSCWAVLLCQAGRINHALLHTGAPIPRRSGHFFRAATSSSSSSPAQQISI